MIISRIAKRTLRVGLLAPLLMNGLLPALSQPSQVAARVEPWRSTSLTNAFSTVSKSTMQHHTSAWTQEEVVPHVIDAAPAQVLEVTWDHKVTAKLGNELTPTQVQHRPTLKWEADEKTFYTVIMTDPDAPSRQQPKFREWVHWVVANVPGNNIKAGEEVAQYVGSGPPEGTGLHRYVLLVLRQPGKLDLSKEAHLVNTSGDGRGKWSAAKWAQKHLGVSKISEALVAGNFYQAQWDDYVPKLYEQLSGGKKQ